MADLFDEAVSGTEQKRRGKVRWVRAVALLLLALGLGNLGKAGMALRYGGLLPDLPMTVSWTYLAVTGVFWGVALVACGAALWRLWPWARWAAPAVVTLYQAHVWLNHLLFDASDYALQTRPRDLLLSGLLLAFVWGTLRPSIQRRFRPKRRT